MAKPKIRKAETQVVSRNLTDSSTLLCRIYQTDTIYSTVLSWRVPGYEQLQEDVMYYESYENPVVSCKLRMIMRSSALYLCVVGKTIPHGSKAEFTVIGEPSLKTIIMEAEEIDSKIFATEFPRRSYFGPCLDSLRSDRTLTVSFKYESDHKVAYKTSYMDQKEMLGDLVGMCCDLKKMYYEAICFDFLIHVREYTFKTHRFILSGRSGFFTRLFTKDKKATEYVLEGFNYPGIVHEVLDYMYSGDLRVMDLACMLHVFDLSVRLRVPELHQRCVKYFKANLNEENCRDIAIFARRKGYAVLKNIVAYFLPTLPGVNIVEYFKDIEREFREQAR